jgi:hypothetical protein
MALPPFATVLLFALLFANTQQHIAILVPAVAKSCTNTEKKSKKTLHSNHRHRSVYASMQIGGS